MATTPLRKCSSPGCRELIREGSKCDKHRSKQRKIEDSIRGTAAERGYNYRWQKVSLNYRSANPLCVECLLKGKVRAVQCVDHIVPHCGRQDLMWNEVNFCSLCWSCHTRKTTHEEELMQWEPVEKRVVVCGLPGVGKSTRAIQVASEWKCDVFDWDDEGKKLGLDTRKDILDSEHQRLMEVRKRWLIGHRSGAAIMIVTRPFTALKLASSMEGSVMHITCDETTRVMRLSVRDKALG